ncbi:MAG: YitT family protein [Oscillospiraceae bacterium]|nr:YitT family protein [Oscillospiraceae bacterium]
MAANIRSFLRLTFGTVLVIIGVYFFKFPNNFSTGGVTGISMIIAKLIPTLSPGTMVLIINMALLVVAFFFLGNGFGVKTVYCSVLLSLGVKLLEIVYPMNAPFTDQPLMELVYAVMLPAIGSAFLFNENSSTGGTDIVAMILKKYTNIDIGRALMLSDAAIVAIACFIFGIRTGLFCIMGLAMKSVVVDTVIENFNLCKYFTIITTKPNEICQFIESELGRSATVTDATGHFSGEARTIVITVVRRSQAVRLRRWVKIVDPGAFTMITNTSEIIGKGFRGMN